MTEFPSAPPPPPTIGRMAPLGLASLLMLSGALMGTPAEAQVRFELEAPVGFSTQLAARQEFCEQRFLELPSSDAFREHLRIITAAPHPTGSAQQVEVGNYLERVMKAAGMTVRKHPYDVYLPQLTDDVEVHIVSPVAMRLSNREPELDDDRFVWVDGLNH